jgi:hypothetical protein
MRVLLAAVALLLPLSAASSQRIEVRVAGGGPAVLSPGDTLPLEVVAWNGSGTRVLPRDARLIVTPPCAGWREQASVGTARRVILWLQDGCAGVPGRVVAEWNPDSTWRRSELVITSPVFPRGSDLAICLATHPRTLRYTSRDTVVALATRGRDEWIADAMAGTALGNHPWPGGAVVTLQAKAVLCTPRYRAADVTRSTRTTWSTSDTTIAAVDQRGTIRWKDGGTWAVRAAYRKP